MTGNQESRKLATRVEYVEARGAYEKKKKCPLEPV
jgi:hypothetical protein